MLLPVRQRWTTAHFDSLQPTVGHWVALDFLGAINDDAKIAIHYSLQLTII